MMSLWVTRSDSEFEEQKPFLRQATVMRNGSKESRTDLSDGVLIDVGTPQSYTQLKDLYTLKARRSH